MRRSGERDRGKSCTEVENDNGSWGVVVGQTGSRRGSRRKAQRHWTVWEEKNSRHGNRGVGREEGKTEGTRQQKTNKELKASKIILALLSTAETKPQNYRS